MRSKATLLKAAALLCSVAVCKGRKVLDLDELYNQTDTALFSEVYNQTLEWGTYKPNMFFGLKDRSPNPVTVGMIWGVPVQNEGLDFMYTFNYGGNDAITGRFEYHDGWGSSRQIVRDPYSNAIFEIEYVKEISTDDNVTMSNLTSEWKALITIKPIDPT